MVAPIFVTYECGCIEWWDKIGAPVDLIPDCVFTGVWFFDDERSAVKKWLETRPLKLTAARNGHPYYGAIHVHGRHILDIKFS